MTVIPSAETSSVAKAGQKSSSRPFGVFERLVAWRYLRSKRKETVVSVIAGFSFAGIMLGVATLIIVMAVMNGFRAELINRILGINGHMVVQAIDLPLNDYEELSKRLETVVGVQMALPIVEGQTLASGNSGAGTGALVRGISVDDISRLEWVSKNIKAGDLVAFAAGDGVLIGTRMADSLGLIAGDDITLVSPEGDVTPFGVTPRVKSYPISGVFEIGMSEYDSSIIYMPLTEAQLYFNTEDEVQSIEVFIDDPDEVDTFRPLLEAAAERQIFITDWQQRNRTFFSALEVERNVMFMILTLIILVAALNIISGLIMLVKDKGRDIAILRTMGATSTSIMRIFFMTGSAIGIAGTGAGVIMGVLVCLNVEGIRNFFSWLSGTTLFNPELYFLSQLPADMDLGETIMIIAMAFILTFVATLIPAWRASKIDPVQALRYE